MSTTPALQPSAPPPDRSVRLKVLGGLQVGLGILFGMIAVFFSVVVLGGRLPQPPQGPAFDTRSIMHAVGIYVVLGIAFVWVGIGMIRIRRWAWALTLVLSWMAFLFGLVAFASTQILMTRQTWETVTQQAHLTPEAISFMRLWTALMMFCFYVVLPGIFVAGCQPKAVRETVDRLDPTPRWTDRCPLPVLALCIINLVGVTTPLTMQQYDWTFPVFGFFLTGAAGAAATIAIAVFCAWLAWGTYRLNLLAWWGTLMMMILGTLNWAVALWRGDLMVMFKKMHLPADQIEIIRKMGILEAGSVWPILTASIAGAAWLGYLLYVRRYFVRKAATVNVAP